MSLLSKVEAPEKLKSLPGFEHRIHSPQGEYISGVRNAVPNYFKETSFAENAVYIYGDLFVDRASQRMEKVWTPSLWLPFATVKKSKETRIQEFLLRDIKLNNQFSNAFYNFLHDVRLKLLSSYGFALPDEETAEKLLRPVFDHYNNLAKGMSREYYTQLQKVLHPEENQTSDMKVSA